MKGEYGAVSIEPISCSLTSFSHDSTLTSDDEEALRRTPFLDDHSVDAQLVIEARREKRIAARRALRDQEKSTPLTIPQFIAFFFGIISFVGILFFVASDTASTFTTSTTSVTNATLSAITDVSQIAVSSDTVTR